MCELPQAYSYKVRTARKNHPCCECNNIIPKGDKYHYHSGVWDFEPNSFKICNRCEELRNKINKGKDIYDTVPFGELYS